jgi:hypothetical protein
MKTIINSGDISALLKNLSEHTLDPCFEDYGNFINSNLYKPKYDSDKQKWVDDTSKPIYPDDIGMVRFFGNFFDYSAVFSIDTNDPILIEQLSQGIKVNQSKHSYKDAKTKLHNKWIK